MFLIFKVMPDWIWGLLLIAGFFSYFLSYLKILTTYSYVLKIFSYISIPTIIFIFGMLYADSTWTQAAKELEAKVVVAEAKSVAANSVITQKTIVKTQVIKQRGEDIIQYVDREVTKYNNTCVIPKEFIITHNRAAEQTK